MNPKANFGNGFSSKLRGIIPSLRGIVQLTNSAALRFRNWSFNNKWKLNLPRRLVFAWAFEGQ